MVRVLGWRRIAALTALTAVLVAYYLVHQSLPNLGLWADTALLSAGLIPAVFALVWLVLPLQRARGLLGLVVALAVLAVIAELGDVNVLANFAKLAAMTAFAFYFLDLFDGIGPIILIALVIPWIDAYSVWRGPTGNIVKHHPQVFSTFSFAFAFPGEDDAAHLGLPDLLFFALFLAAAARWGLRVGWTWVGMVGALGAAITIAVWQDVAGIPALPAISAGLLLANADILIRRAISARSPA
jgi:hypothetical protein